MPCFTDAWIFRRGAHSRPMLLVAPGRPGKRSRSRYELPYPVQEPVERRRWRWPRTMQSEPNRKPRHTATQKATPMREVASESIAIALQKGSCRPPMSLPRAGARSRRILSLSASSWKQRSASASIDSALSDRGVLMGPARYRPAASCRGLRGDQFERVAVGQDAVQGAGFAAVDGEPVLLANRHDGSSEPTAVVAPAATRPRRARLSRCGSTPAWRA